MDIKLKKEEDVSLDYNECPRCHRTFNLGTRKKTKHHAIPEFMKPLSKVLMNLCLECHTELNSYYRIQEIQNKKYRKTSENFGQFIETYEKLRKDFYDKKINRGQFGEGLWSNLVSYLESTQNTVGYTKSTQKA
jgi:protein-arginine kinase activator protein McsA